MMMMYRQKDIGLGQSWPFPGIPGASKDSCVDELPRDGKLGYGKLSWERSLVACLGKRSDF